MVNDSITETLTKLLEDSLTLTLSESSSVTVKYRRSQTIILELANCVLSFLRSFESTDVCEQGR